MAIPPAVIALDRVTKAWIERNMSFWDSYGVIPNFFSIVHVQNRGAAFGILADAAGAWRTFFLIGISLLVTAIIAGMLWQSLRRKIGHGPALAFGLALVLGGAIGNMYDRILRGSVTDFLLFYIGEYQWPAFNVADSAISVGACLLLLDIWLEHRARARGAVRAA
jgi:signal peptidase II